MKIIFDLDGTLADIDHRLSYVKVAPKNFKAFEKACVYDGVNAPVAFMNRQLAKVADIYIFSGRSEDVITETKEWLAKHDIKYIDIWMRQRKDYRRDSVVKQEMLDKFIALYGQKPDIVFDDRKQVIDMWKNNGIFVLDCSRGNNNF